MKHKHFILVAMLLFLGIVAQAQKKTIITDFCRVYDEFHLRGKIIQQIETDSTFASASHNRLPTVKAVKDYVTAQGGDVYQVGLVSPLPDPPIKKGSVALKEYDAFGNQWAYFWNGSTWVSAGKFLGTSSVSGNEIAPGAVTSSDIRDTTIVSSDIKDGAVTGAKIAQEGATSGQVLAWNGTAWAPTNQGSGADNWGSQVVQTTGATLGGNGTSGSPLSVANDGIGSAQIAPGAVTSSDIRDTTIVSSDIKDGAVTSAKLATSGVTAGTHPNTGQSVPLITVNNKGIITAISTIPESDGSTSNEGVIGVGAGASNTSLITSNSGTASGVTLVAETGLSIAETTASNGGSITLSVANDGIGSAQIAPGAVTSSDIRDTTIVSSDIKDGAVTGAKIAQNGATSGQVLAWNGTAWAPTNQGSGADNWGSQVVQTAGATLGGNGTSGSPLSVANDGIGSAQIAPGAVTSSDIRDTTIVSSDIKDGAVTGAKIAQNGATSGQVLAWNGSTWAPANQGSGADNWGSQTVQTTGSTLSGNGTGGSPLLVANDGIGTAQIAPSGVTSSDIRDTTITTADIKDEAVTAAKLSTSGVTAGTYGSETLIPVITVDSKGRVTDIFDASFSTLSQGVIGVSAGTSNTAVITSNTPSANGVTVTVGTGLSISESVSSNGGSFTLTNTGDTNAGDDLTTSSSAGGGVISGTFSNLSLASQSVQTGNLANNAVNFAKLQQINDGVLLGRAAGAGLGLVGEIASSARITTAGSAVDIVSESVGAAQIGPSGVTSSEIRDTTITSADLKNEAVTGAKIAQGGATSGQVLAWNGSTWAPANQGSGADNWGSQVVQTTGETLSGNGTGGSPMFVANNGIGTAQIAPGEVTSSDIRDTTITSADLKNEAVTGAKIAQGGATSGQVLAWNGSTWAAANQSGADNWGSQVVQTTGSTLSGNGTGGSPLFVANDGIGTTQIVASGVTSSDIRDTTITTSDIKDGAVTDAKVANVSAAKLTSGVLPSSFAFTATTSSTARINYNGGNTALLVDDANSAGSVFSKDGEQYFSANNTSASIGSGTSKIVFQDGSTEFWDSDATHKITVKPPATGTLTSNWTLTLPADDGAADQVLKTDGSGNTSWATPSGGGSSAVTFSQFTSDQDDITTTGLADATLVRVSGDVDIVGISSMSSSGVSDGETKTICNVGTHPVVLQAQHPDGTPANRFNAPSDIILSPGRCHNVIYDNTSSGWRSVGASVESGNVSVFDWNAASATSGDWGNVTFLPINSGSVGTTIDANNNGPIHNVINSNATSNGGGSIWLPKSGNAYYSGSSYSSLTGLVRVSALSDATETYSAGVRYALGANSDFTASHQVGIMYTHSLNSGRWTGYARNISGTLVSVDLGVTVVADQLYSLEVVVDKGLGEVRFFVDGVYGGRLTSGLPNTATLTNPGAVLLKSAGNTSRTLKVSRLKLMVVYPGF